MKLFSIKRLIGLGAIYGAVQYARRHGGPKNAFNELIGRAKEKMNEARDFVGDAKREVADGQARDFASGSGGFASEDRSVDGAGLTGSNQSSNGRGY